jgi:hypothetical protein
MQAVKNGPHVTNIPLIGLVFIIHFIGFDGKVNDIFWIKSRPNPGFIGMSRRVALILSKK